MSEAVERSNGWTTETLRVHMAELREEHQRFEQERDRRYLEVAAERDRRYLEVDVEKANAIKIKEAADHEALMLAREIQVYKDEKANNLRTQIEQERGSYPTRAELSSAIDKIGTELKPVFEYVARQQGGPRALTMPMVVTGVGFVLTILTLVGVIAALVSRVPAAAPR